MRRVRVTGVLVFVASAVTPSAQSAPQTPGPLDNLVASPNPLRSRAQVDAPIAAEWRRVMREKYEGKFPGPAPRTPEGKPDLNGVWIAEATPERPVMTPLGLSLLEHRFKTDLKDFPYALCLPPAAVPTDLGNGLWMVMHNRTHLTTLFEFPPNYRQVLLDGRLHPPDVEPAWMGHSIGRWDGDVLVVDSIGFNDKSWLTSLLPHTANLHITERWTRVTLGSMSVELIHEDPDIFVKPWKVVFRLFLAPGENLMENVCENNKLLQPSAGQIP